ncbi:CBN-DNJ-4 protein [Aphelenchoides avenae]|nr:CBN-DNJ-4 protein [Aphelenchus avenae]KAH7723567.1 CBN-DNJ-4 protein [Aphelenchus avenae]
MCTVRTGRGIARIAALQTTSHLHSAAGSSHRSYYEVLGIDRTATQDDIKRAYYDKCKKLHPDGSELTGSEQAFCELKEAYDVLRKPSDRRMYDLGVRVPGGYSQRTRSTSADWARHSQGFSHAAGSHHHGGHYNYSGQDWRTFWQTHYEKRESSSTEEDEVFKRNRLVWRRMVRFTAAGLFLVTCYNVSYWYAERQRTRQEFRDLQSINTKDELARSFLRQREHRDKFDDRLEIEAFAKLLGGDIEEAYKRRLEEIRKRNPLEIREEARWMAAVKYKAPRDASSPPGY